MYDIVSQGSPSSVHARITLFVIIAFALTLVTLTLGSPHRSTSEAVRLSLTHQPERLTELYFTAPQSVPSVYDPAVSTVSEFTLHNLEYRDQTYTYRVLVQGVQVGDTYKTVVSDGAYKHIQLELPAGEYGERVKVSVELIGRGQAIHFWLERQK